MFLPKTTVARKLLMAVTGQMMLLFVIAHVLGNSTIYFSNLNAYAAALHALPLLLWSYRVIRGNDLSLFRPQVWNELWMPCVRCSSKAATEMT